MAMSLDERRRRKREAMAERRLNPRTRPSILESQRRAYANGGLAKQQKKREARKELDWFKWREQFVRRTEPGVTASDIATLWEKQGGLCALTGVPLTKETAHLDHITPLVRGGRGLGLSNLRWVAKEVNLAKRDLTDEEFLALCNSVIEWLSHRLARAIEANP